jgi:hypothetical protein
MPDVGIICLFLGPPLLVVLIFAIFHRAPSPRTRRSIEVSSDRTELVIGLGREEISLQARKRTLKICPDCRELVVLQAAACKYCGCVLAVEEKKEPALVLRSGSSQTGAK